MEKRYLRVFFAASLIVFVLAMMPVGVSASDFAWNTGVETDLNLKSNPVPYWLQLFSRGVKIEKPATLCHPFDKGRFYWVANIYQLKDGKWIKLPTTMKWIPTTEGAYSACTDAKEAGVYALLAFYNGPTPTPSPTPDLSGDWNTGKEINIDTVKYPVPSGLQYLYKGVQVEKKTLICHSFTIGLHGWVADIRQLKDGKWQKLTTTTSWIPTREGTYSACANAPEAGTYALFGYLE